MIPIQLKDLLLALPAAMLIRGEPKALISSVSTDTRSLKPNDIFIPLRGRNFDGHNFIAQALELGAGGFFFDTASKEIDRILAEHNGEIIALAVPDGLKALHHLANLVRRRLKIPVIGITGSSGKTTTKEMLSSILTQGYKVLSSSENFNNEVGLALTILQADKKTEAMVLEMGMRGPGQIRELCEVAEPNVGIITNIGRAHYGLLGSEKAIAETKSELIDCIEKGGAVILNHDDKWTPSFMALIKSKLITYGLSKGADVFGEILSLTGSLNPKLRIHYQDSFVDVEMVLSGKHNAYNALAAAGAALWLGMELDLIKDGLESFIPPRMRMEVDDGRAGLTIINDAYNANPESMGSAIESLSAFPARGRRIAVLGDMAELGEISDASHMAIGKSLKDNEIDLVFTVGRSAAKIAEGAILAGIDKEFVFHAHDLDAAAKVIKNAIEDGDVVLFKASRIMRFEELIDAIR